MSREAPTPARCLAVLGTASDVGKSVVATALCRIMSDAGVRVAPYKAQNMSNNSYVTAGGGEMGRAQIAQAEAARVEPHVDMNPVLLKPSGDTVSQVVLHGKAIGNRAAGEYFRDTSALFNEARASLERLRRDHELIVMEGAGSCAEVNLRERDIVNFRIAREGDAPVILVADIDRGGVFAQVVGTLEVLPPEDRELVKGVVVNRFRGDAALFKDGIDFLERRTGLPVLGLVPFFRHVEIDCEDGVVLEDLLDPGVPPDSSKLACAVIRLPHISNFTDFAPLGREAGVDLHYLATPRALDGYDLVLLPGTKNARSDADWLVKIGWARVLREYVDMGGRVGGVCGGYQIIGKLIRDPHGIEGPPGETRCLGLLDVETELLPEKTLRRSSGEWLAEDGLGDGARRVEGYEIHMGVTARGPDVGPTARLADVGGGREAQPFEDGARSADGRVWGTYLHGLFDAPGFRRAFIADIRPDLASGADEGAADCSAVSFRDRQYDALADHFRAHLDLTKLCAIADPDGELRLAERVPARVRAGGSRGRGGVPEIK
ncbi:MAG: cobyric acid synthase [Planctomycetota bacterium]|jgi:adenosylcobyric acid synthase